MKTDFPSLELNKWRFQLDQEDVGESFGWHLPEHDHSVWMDVNAPGAWDFYDLSLRGYEGAGWYAAEIVPFPTEADRQYLMQFTGIGGRAWVWVNGQPAGYNAIRYLPFEVNIDKFIKRGEKNLIAIKVDNSFQGEQHLPGGTKIEWALYGGLIHRIHLRAVTSCRIEAVTAKTDDAGNADFKVALRNDGLHDFAGKIKLHMDTETPCDVDTDVVCPAGQQREISIRAEAGNVTPWSPENPMLYSSQFSLEAAGKSLHSATVRLGFRYLETKNAQILLNGKPLFIKGFNRYDEYYPYGSSVPEELIRDDLENIKKCGANLIRVHYPQDPIHLEIADELGLMYLLEIPLNWWNPEPVDRLKDFPDLHQEAMDTLYRTFRCFGDHPSWGFWSMSNECRHTPACLELVSRLGEKARRLDSGRLITNVINFIPQGNEFEFCDFIGFNNYNGSNKTVKNLEELPAHIDAPTREAVNRLATLYPEKPIVICEFGAIGIRGMMGGSRMSENRQAFYLKHIAAVFREHPHVCGLVLWAWADYFHNRNFLAIGPTFLSLRALFGPYGVVTVDRKIKSVAHQAITEIFAACP